MKKNVRQVRLQLKILNATLTSNINEINTCLARAKERERERERERDGHHGAERDVHSFLTLQSRYNNVAKKTKGRASPAEKKKNPR